MALGEQLAGAFQSRQQSGFVALVAVELRLLDLLLGAIRLFAAQAEVAVEAELKLAGLVLNQFVDDCALPRTGGLKERDLALRFEGFALNQFLFSLTVPNFNSIAMAPLGSIAGTAASFIGSYTTLLGACWDLSLGAPSTARSSRSALAILDWVQRASEAFSGLRKGACPSATGWTREKRSERFRLRQSEVWATP